MRMEFEGFKSIVLTTEGVEMDTINSITMHLEIAPGDGYGGAVERYASAAVSIDGEPLDLGADWDVLALILCAERAGPLYLANCGCGVPACAGISDPVNIDHVGGLMAWRILRPYVDGRTGEHDGADTFTFDLAQYREEAGRLLAELLTAYDTGQPFELACDPLMTQAKVRDWLGRYCLTIAPPRLG